MDRYYRVLRNDPNNDEARYMLIQFLMNESRYEEAMEQLQYLAPNHEGTNRFESIKESLMTIRQAYYEEKIDSNQTALKEDPNNRDALSNIVDYYINLDDHEVAEELLREYLEMNPDDHELRFKLAQVYYLFKENLMRHKQKLIKLLKLIPIIQSTYY
ncbi:MAG: tetratricopeptide repeat protein [Melioribacteraceae bacterium]|nr:tetratricopeptide repeat protein [Melioribacteraceae bacterium]